MKEGDPGDSFTDSDSGDDLLTDSENNDEEYVGSLSSSDESDEDDTTPLSTNEDDALISSITSRQEITSTKPAPIKSDDLFTDLSFHPEHNIIAMSCLSGNIEVYTYSPEENVLKGTIEAHIKSCRALEFSSDGKIIYSIGRDRHVVFSDVETFDMKMFIDVAHHAPMTSLCVPSENILTTGDDEGVVKIWDTRYIQNPIFKAHDAHDYISCISSKGGVKVACTSGDGTLISYDLRANKKLQESAPVETDLTCCTSTHSETMLVCGSMTGQFLFYKWNDFSDISGTFKPLLRKKSPINTVLQISENIVLAGMEDGHIRAYHFFPHKEIGVVGQHDLNIERLDISNEGNLIASLSPDPMVKFWDISYLEGFEVSGLEKSKIKGGKNLPSSEFDDRRSFFSDLS